MGEETENRFQRLEGIFGEASAIPDPFARQSFLDAACQKEPSLALEIRRLLAADQTIQRRTRPGAVDLPRFGPYRAGKLIGRGGMGAVYLAARDDGEVRIDVAVKAIGAMLWVPGLEERFRRERQILAQLRHPNIAAFLDAGITENDVPYLVMEYVDGEPLDHYCDTLRLSVRQRLNLFLKICGAVSFAHQQLVVHRDIKPSNILIDTNGDPKLLDFGVARTLDTAPALDAAGTATTGLFVTPRYASPDVLRGKPASVSDDIYSLGVVLYELMSGKQPFGTASTTPAEVMKAVLDGEPLPASHIAGPASGSAAENRSQTVSGLRRALRGDLDAIAAKAMNRSAAGRYSSVEQLSLDVSRHLQGHPVQAVPSSLLTRTHKLIARNKAAFAAAMLVTISLVGGAAGILWQERIAKRRFAQARELAHYLMFDLEKSVRKLPGATPVRQEMVAHSLAYLDQLSAEQIGDPRLRTEVGEGYAQLGSLLGNQGSNNIGQPQKAKESYLKALAILKPAAADPSNRRAGQALAKTKMSLGQLLDFQSNEGRGLIRSATDDLGRLVARWPDDFDLRIDASRAYFALGRSLCQSRGGYITGQNIESSLAAFNAAISHAEAAARLQPHNPDPRRQLALSYNMVASLHELHDPSGATPFFRKALAALDQVEEKDRELPLVRSNRSSVLLGLGRNLGQLGQTRAGEAYLEEARQIRDRVAAEDPKDVQSFYLSLFPYFQLADLCAVAGRKRDELRYRLRSIEMLDKLLAGDRSNNPYRFMQAEEQSHAANLSWDLGFLKAAARLEAAGIPELKRAAMGPQASATDQLTAASALLDAKVPGFADAPLALVFAKRSLAANPDDTDTLQVAAKAYWLNRDRASAVKLVEHALQLTSSTPTRGRKELEATLARYRGASLPG